MIKTCVKIPYSCQTIGREEKQAVQNVLDSDWLTQGPKVAEFEKALAKKVGAKYAVTLANGTAALHLISLAIDLKTGDEVITTPISFLATSNAILYCGATPVFVDIDPLTQNLDPKNIEKEITKKTKAIYVTDFAGYPAEMQKISLIAKKHKLIVIEDAAHALGATYRNIPVGNCRYSKATIFSFHPVKHITTGEGGAITTNDKKIYEKLLSLRTHGMTKDPKKLTAKNQGNWYYEMHDLGYNYRMCDIQAALGIEQLKKLDRFIAARRKAATIYNRLFNHYEYIDTPYEGADNKHAYHLYVIRLKGEKLINKRKQIFDALQKKGIGVQIHYIPIPMQPFYKKLGYQFKKYPEAVNYYNRAISIPLFPTISRDQQIHVVNTIKTIIDSYK
jgi:perosamine synthetase